MLTRKLKTSVLTVVIALVVSAGANKAFAANKFVVSFRLTKWKTAHFDDAGTAKSNYDTMRRIGCEAKQGAHGGHFDLSYRTLRWRSISLKTDREAHQWAHWLKASGFETVFVQPAHVGHLETVAFRLASSKSGHFDSKPQADSQADTLRMLGCEVKQEAHGKHHDVTYRCSQWRVIGVEGHTAAHGWQEWLKANGFETKHEHKTAKNRGASRRR